MKADPQTKILVIDDEKAIRQSFRFYLEDKGFSITEAENGRVGLELFGQEPSDIVLVDLRMPEVDGYEVLRHLSSSSPDTPLIVISGTGNIADTIEALHLGAWDYILKPVSDLSILLHAITKALERVRLVRENRDHQRHLEQEVERRTSEMTDKMAELTRFNRMAVGRERRIIELKRSINSLLTELGHPPKYRAPDLIEEDASLTE